MWNDGWTTYGSRLPKVLTQGPTGPADLSEDLGYTEVDSSENERSGGATVTGTGSILSLKRVRLWVNGLWINYSSKKQSLGRPRVPTSLFILSEVR